MTENENPTNSINIILWQIRIKYQRSNKKSTLTKSDTFIGIIFYILPLFDQGQLLDISCQATINNDNKLFLSCPTQFAENWAANFTHQLSQEYQIGDDHNDVKIRQDLGTCHVSDLPSLIFKKRWKNRKWRETGGLEKKRAWKSVNDDFIEVSIRAISCYLFDVWKHTTRPVKTNKHWSQACWVSSGKCLPSARDPLSFFLLTF